MSEPTGAQGGRRASGPEEEAGGAQGTGVDRAHWRPSRTRGRSPSASAASGTRSLGVCGRACRTHGDGPGGVRHRGGGGVLVPPVARAHPECRAPSFQALQGQGPASVGALARHRRAAAPSPRPQRRRDPAYLRAPPVAGPALLPTLPPPAGEAASAAKETTRTRQPVPVRPGRPPLSAPRSPPLPASGPGALFGRAGPYRGPLRRGVRLYLGPHPSPGPGTGPRRTWVCGERRPQRRRGGADPGGRARSQGARPGPPVSRPDGGWALLVAGAPLAPLGPGPLHRAPAAESKALARHGPLPAPPRASSGPPAWGRLRPRPSAPRSH